MMHDALVAGPQLDRPNVLSVPHTDRDYKIPKDVAAACSQPVGRRHLYNQVGRAHLPSFGELRLSRQIGGLTFRRALFHPLCDKTQLIRGEAALADEITVTRLGRPWRHVPALGDCDNLRSMLA